MRLPGFLRRNLGLKALALALAMVSWVGVVVAGNPPETRTVSVPVPQDSGRVPSQYVLVRRIPDVPVRLAGTREHLAAFDPASLVVTVDFAAITHPGDQLLPVTVINRDRDVELDSAPASVEVDVDELESSVVPVTIVITAPPPAGYVCVDEAASPDRVTVAGPHRYLGGIQVRALVDLGNQKANFQQDVPLLVFDATGSRLSSLGLTPPTARVTITIAASATYRAAAVLPRLEGAVAPGHQITAISVSPTAVRLAGPQDLINTLDSVDTLPISIAGATADVAASARLDPPAGVRATPDTVTVRVSVAPLQPVPPAPQP